MPMFLLFKNIRFYVLVFSLSLSSIIYYWVKLTVPDGTLQIIRLTQIYALTALSYLYIVLLIGPVIYLFKFLPFRGQIYRARRALGVSTFYFATLHAYHAFFKQLGGFAGLGFLDGKYLLAISLSFTALVILSLMAATSFDFMVAKLGAKWKILHRFIYLAGFLIIVHALLLGTHFQDLSATIPQIFLSALAILLLLEANRFDAFLTQKFPTLPRFGISLVVAVSLVAIYFFSSFVPQASLLSLGIHAQHIQLAKQAQSGQALPTNLPNLPGLQGDRTKRFTVSFIHPDNVGALQDTPLIFKVYDASTGNPVVIYDQVYSKVMHLVVVDSELKFFNHIHPDLTEKGFTITTQFPKDGVYHLYLDFQPRGAIEQQIAFTINVGNVEKPLFSNQEPDANLTKTFDNYKITLSAPNPLKSDQLSIGRQTLTFTIKDATTKQPITNLRPYLAAFGHLVMINQETFDYLHVHPATLTPPPPDANGGPNVDFLPLGLYGPIKPGIYRVFAQFNPDSKLFVADFTIKIE